MIVKPFFLEIGTHVDAHGLFDLWEDIRIERALANRKLGTVSHDDRDPVARLRLRNRDDLAGLRIQGSNHVRKSRNPPATKIRGHELVVDTEDGFAVTATDLHLAEVEATTVSHRVLGDLAFDQQ